ncbi:hypothetical protein K457DRAFT_35594 [Linnemannia elongata AG-77]|uniref:Uncharacterized protein n=1 Tax=Linnemannia elongata AG-77 TaxID=1314771 RepID=A0A197JHX5_9FUNG|nr:hypothetical protein K457DRAFT_35594 [Linnemannia elongata AG-77]
MNRSHISGPPSGPLVAQVTPYSTVTVSHTMKHAAQNHRQSGAISTKKGCPGHGTIHHHFRSTVKIFKRFNPVKINNEGVMLRSGPVQDTNPPPFFHFKMRFAAIAGLFLVVAATFAEAGRQCSNGAPGCNACVCNQWADTQSCCGNGAFNDGNGNCEGLKHSSVGSFKDCCNDIRGFGRCW